MEKYKIRYNLKFRHNYYREGLCRAIEVRVNPASVDIMRRNGLLLRRTQVNNWCIIGNSESIIPDVIFLDLIISDPNFLNYTEWKEFKPSFLYELALPAGNKKATEVFKPTKNIKKSGSVFSTAALRLGNKVTNDILTFDSRKLHWVYIFIPRNGIQPDKNKYSLKESKARLNFEPFSAVKIFGNEALQTQSKTEIAMNEQYDFDLCLCEVTGSSTLYEKDIKKPLPYPKPTVSRCDDSDVLQQICYF